MRTLILLFSGIISLSVGDVGFLWQNDVISESEVAQTLTWFRTNLDPELRVQGHQIDSKSVFRLNRLVCSLIRNGTSIFLTYVSCSTRRFLNSALSDLELPMVAVVTLNNDCDHGDKDEETGRNIYRFPPTSGQTMIDLTVAMVTELGWPSLAFLHDDTWSDAAIQRLRQGLLLAGDIKIADFEIKSTNDIKSLISKKLSVEEAGRHVLMVGDTANMAHLLQRTNAYDKAGIAQALFSFGTDLLFLGAPSDVATLTPSVGNLDNVAILVSPQEMSLTPSEALQEAFGLIEDGSIIMRGGYFHTTNNKSTNGVFLYDDSSTVIGQSCQGEGQTLAKEWIDALQMSYQDLFNSSYPTYSVLSARVRARGRREFETVLQYTLGGWEKYGDIFPNKALGLNGRHLKNSVLEWSPFTIKEYGNSSLVLGNSSLVWDGLCLEILAELSRNLNFSYSLVSPSDGEWGRPWTEGNWTGVVGQLITGEADISVLPITVSVIRDQVIDFSEPFFVEHFTVMAALPDTNATKWKLYLQPFKPEVWLSIAAAIPFVALVTWFVSRTSPYYCFSPRQTGLVAFDNAIIYCFGSFFTQGGKHLPFAQSGRFVIGFWWMYVIVVVATYSGNLIAFFTVTKSELPFKNIAELVNQTDYEYGCVPTNSFGQSLQGAREGSLLHQLWLNMQQQNTSLSNNHTEHLERVFKGDYAYLVEGTSAEIEMSMAGTCQVEMTKEEYFSEKFAVALQNRSAFNEIFSLGIQKIREGGLLRKWRAKYWPKQNFCSRGLVTEALAVSILDVQGAYYVLAFLLSLALLSLVLENLIALCRRCVRA